MSPLHDIIAMRRMVELAKEDQQQANPIVAKFRGIVGKMIWLDLQGAVKQLRADGGWVSERGERQGDRTTWRFNLRGHRDTISMTDEELEQRKLDMEDRLLKLVDRIYGNRESPRPS